MHMVTICVSPVEGSLRMDGTKRTSAQPGADAFVGKDLRARYAAMAADETRERDANAWTEGLIADVADPPRRQG